ncbi:hypothetical protein PCE1_001852 [Barthelona sp. PCE]
MQELTTVLSITVGVEFLSTRAHSFTATFSLDNREISCETACFDEFQAETMFLPFRVPFTFGKKSILTVELSFEDEEESVETISVPVDRLATTCWDCYSIKTGSIISRFHVEEYSLSNCAVLLKVAFNNASLFARCCGRQGYVLSIAHEGPVGEDIEVYRSDVYMTPEIVFPAITLSCMKLCGGDPHIMLSIDVLNAVSLQSVVSIKRSLFELMHSHEKYGEEQQSSDPEVFVVDQQRRLSRTLTQDSVRRVSIHHPSQARKRSRQLSIVMEVASEESDRVSSTDNIAIGVPNEPIPEDYDTIPEPRRNSVSVNSLSLSIQKVVLYEAPSFVTKMTEARSIELSFVIDGSRSAQAIPQYRDQINFLLETLTSRLGVYDHNAKYGGSLFGVKPAGSSIRFVPFDVQHEFSLEKLKKKFCWTLDNVVSLELSVLMPSLLDVMNFTSSADEGVYHLVFVLTTGSFLDERTVADTFVSNSELPVSYCLIGLGDLSGHDALQRLDDIGLVSTSNKHLVRDIISYAPFDYDRREDEEYIEDFISRCLAEFPNHFMGYCSQQDDPFNLTI